MSKIKYDIVKDLPIPKRNSGRGMGRESVYPFDRMAIGDCLKFEAEDKHSSAFRKLYNAAKANARRRDSDYDFRFAQLDDRHFGCWKVEKTGNSGTGQRRKRRTNLEINSIPLQVLKDALHTEGTLAGAARKVDLHPITFTRLLTKYGIISK